MNRITLIVFILLLIGCGRKPESSTLESPSETKVESLDGLEIHQLRCPCFDVLPRQSKLYAYHLYQACVAGREIAIDQRIQHGPELLRFIDFLTQKKVITSPTLAPGWDRYCKLFRACNGNYRPVDSHKFIPAIDPEAFWNQVNPYFRSSGTHLDEVFPNVRNAGIFDASFNPILVCCSDSTTDPIAGSAINLYGPSLTYDRIKGYKRQARNGRLVLKGDQLVEDYYRISSEGGLQGRMLGTLSNIVTSLQSAIGYAPALAVPMIDQLIDHLISGDMQAFCNHLALINKDTSDVIFRIGFYDTNQDPFGQRGVLGGLVLVKNDSATAKLRFELSEHNDKQDYFAYDILCATGCYGPICPIWLSGEAGVLDRPLLLSNVMEILAKSDDSLNLQSVADTIIDTEGLHSIQIQNKYVFIMPTLKPVWNRMGTVTDIDLIYTRDFSRQMLEFTER